ncbi:MAG: TraY domain-containing protein [Clostridiales bacterium]|nr:MAG: TraY domain-containing protein [Clostridiales bacterium]
MENEYLEKMRYLAKRETRSLSNLLEHLCKLYIEKYEQDHGKIEMENAEKED